MDDIPSTSTTMELLYCVPEKESKISQTAVDKALRSHDFNDNGCV
jgi:hypothetical protein